jgi:hypothetical protein
MEANDRKESGRGEASPANTAESESAFGRWARQGEKFYSSP